LLCRKKKKKKTAWAKTIGEHPIIGNRPPLGGKKNPTSKRKTIRERNLESVFIVGLEGITVKSRKGDRVAPQGVSLFQEEKRPLPIHT